MRSRRAGLAILTVAALGLTGCGTLQPQNPVATATVTVTATAGPRAQDAGPVGPSPSMSQAPAPSLDMAIMMMPSASELAGLSTIPSGLKVSNKQLLSGWFTKVSGFDPCSFTNHQMPVFGDETAADPSWSLPVVDFNSHTTNVLYQQAIRLFAAPQGASDFVKRAADKLPGCSSFTASNGVPFTVTRRDMSGLPAGAVAWVRTASTTGTVIIFPVKNAVVRLEGMNVADSDLIAAARLAAQKAGGPS